MLLPPATSFCRDLGIGQRDLGGLVKPLDDRIGKGVWAGDEGRPVLSVLNPFSTDLVERRHVGRALQALEQAVVIAIALQLAGLRISDSVADTVEKLRSTLPATTSITAALSPL